MIHTRSSLENHTRFQTNGQSVYPFSDQNGVKTLPIRAAHTYIAYIRAQPHPPSPPPFGGPGLWDEYKSLRETYRRLNVSKENNFLKDR